MFNYRCSWMMQCGVYICFDEVRGNASVPSLPWFRIRICIASVFAELLDPDLNFEYGSGLTCKIQCCGTGMFIIPDLDFPYPESGFFPSCIADPQH